MTDVMEMIGGEREKQGRAQGSESSLTRNCCAYIKSQTKLKPSTFPILITCITLLKDLNCGLCACAARPSVCVFSRKGWEIEADQNPYCMFSPKAI